MEIIKLGNTENLQSLNTIDDYYLTDKNDFKKAVVVEKSILIKKLVEFKNYTGLIEYDFTILDEHCVAIEIGENYGMEHVIEVDLFNKPFKGIIVKYDSSHVKEIPHHVQHIGDSKYIDISKGCHFRTINSDEKLNKYFKIKKSNPPIYGILMQRVEINCVSCVQIKKNIFDNESLKHYVQIADIKVIYNFSSIQYHNQVIIKPDCIFTYTNITQPSLDVKTRVRFTDSTETSYQGEVLWDGKVNDDVSAVIVSLTKNQLTDANKQYVLDASTMQTHFKVNASGIFVGYFSVIPDVITYKKCKTFDLEVVDPHFVHSFQREPSKEKCFVFKLNDVLNAVILKWKGRIHNQFCMGCELTYDSEEGSTGKYGKDKLFDCAPKRGILITSEKFGNQEITDICEFKDHHKTLQFISIKLGFKIYDQTSICCIEKLDAIDLGNENLKIGCKIMYENKFIGICKFIGKVNNKSSVGIELNLDDINEIPAVFDFINFYVLGKGKLCFMDLETVDIGTFYETESSEELSNGCSTPFPNTIVIYHPGNDPTKRIPGKVKWYGKHDNGNKVCGIKLESEVNENCSSYFLENLFFHKPKHGIIDDEYKIEYNICMETGNSVSPVDSSKTYEKIIKFILKGRVMQVINELITHFSADFIDYVKENKEIMIRPENLEQIIHALYEKNKTELINDILSSIENINETFSVLESLLSKCIEYKKFDFISDILSKITKFQVNEDNNNQICLKLAIKCLEMMKEENISEYQSIYELFIDLCGNLSCYIVDKDIKETFITKLILNNEISQNIIINVFKSKNFDINQQNSKNKSPMELAIDECRSNILMALFDLELLNTEKLQSIYDKFIDDLGQNIISEKVNIIKLIKKQLDKKIPKNYSTCGTERKQESN